MKLVKCYNQVKGDSSEQTQVQVRAIEMNVQIESKLVFQLFFPWTEFVCMFMGKNYLAVLSVIYSLQNHNQTAQVCFRMTTRNFPFKHKFYATVSPPLIKKNLRDS